MTVLSCPLVRPATWAFRLGGYGRPGGSALTATAGDATERGLWGKGGGGPGNPQELNRYSYGLNNPVKNTDPTGHCIGPVIIICVAAAASAATEAAAAVGAVVVGGFVVAGAVFPSGGTLRQREGKEYELDADGNVIPQDDQRFPKGQSTFGDVANAPLTGRYEKIPAGTRLPSGIGIKADGRDVDADSPWEATHHTLFPTRRMSLEDFDEKINEIPRVEGGKKKK